MPRMLLGFSQEAVCDQGAFTCCGRHDRELPQRCERAQVPELPRGRQTEAVEPAHCVIVICKPVSPTS
jgi:hypothetical protein